MIRFVERSSSNGKDFSPSQFSSTAENKFLELFQYHLNGTVRQGDEGGKHFWDVEFKKKINRNIINSVIKKWEEGGYGKARYVESPPSAPYPFGSLLFITRQ